MSHLKSILTALLCLCATALGSAAAAGPIRVACVGDSITYGYLLKHPATESYPADLGRILGSGYDVGNFGVSATTLLKDGDYTYWKRKALVHADAFAPSIVVIMLGTNDSKPYNWARRADFARDAAAMIEHFQSLPSKPKVYVCLAVPVFKNRYGINEEHLAKFRAIWREVAGEHGAGIIDARTPFIGKESLFCDGVHPTVEGAKLLARTVANGILGTSAAAPKP
ncbi:acetylxylan esterase precursor [mine drainage metagenome]|uniref:Acetylxylan esterase n=1 Tax=mine drainage metagenome TaxID=410659 RepID=A0A1J5TCI4_9ZZZZ